MSPIDGKQQSDGVLIYCSVERKDKAAEIESFVRQLERDPVEFDKLFCKLIKPSDNDGQ